MSLASTDPWALTRSLVEGTGRPSVRVAAVDASTGRATNIYSRTRPVSGTAPDAPWAMHLTGTDRRFHFLCFDLDAKEHDSVADAALLANLLDQISVDYVVCQSSGSNKGRGRHVWIGVRDPLDAAVVRQLARVARIALPSLDISPLSNAATGAVRPPGAPHRDGSTSTVLAGNLNALLRPTTAESDVRALLEMLVDAAQLSSDQVAAAASDQATAVPDATALDSTGHLYLVRGTRMMSEADNQMLSQGMPRADASKTLASALTRMVKAGRRHADARRLLGTSPVFEHLRSEAVAGSPRRTRRDPRAAEQMLSRQWRRAVIWVATHTTSFTGTDPDFADRALRTSALVDAVQERADASPGRWKSADDLSPRYFVRGGYSDRIVLDAVCLLVIQSARQQVEASTRHLSTLTGLSRESCRTALLRLEAEGWIRKTRQPDGVRATFWALTAFSTGHSAHDRSQVSPPPPPATGPALRTAWLSVLRARLESLAHDVFAAPGSLGRTAGRVFAHLDPHEPLDLAELSRRSGLRAHLVRRVLRHLRQQRLVTMAHDLWSAKSRDGRPALARRLNVAGFLDCRKRAYEVERQAWVWWCHELSIWMMERAQRPVRKRGAPQRILLHIPGAPPNFPAHPRTSNGLMDWRAARRAVADGVRGGRVHARAAAA